MILPVQKKNARKVFWILYLQNQSIFIWRGPRFALELSDIDAPYILIMVMAHLPEISDNVSFIWSWIFVVTSFSEKLTNKNMFYFRKKARSDVLVYASEWMFLLKQLNTALVILLIYLKHFSSPTFYVIALVSYLPIHLFLPTGHPLFYLILCFILTYFALIKPRRRVSKI